MTTEREELVRALRRQCIKLDTSVGRLRCHQCGNVWTPGKSEVHARGCLAAQPELPPKPSMMSELEARALLDSIGLPWPEVDDMLKAEGCARFVKLVEIESRTEHETVHYLPPTRPSREVVTEWDADDEPVAYRTLDDAEWAAVLESYERAKIEFERRGGRAVIAGPTMVRATFLTDSAARVVLVWTGATEKWMWIEYQLPEGPKRDR